MEEWYKEINDVKKIFQGEILLNFQILTPKKDQDRYILERSEIDCIIISQACDLENRKIDNVMLAEIIDLPIFVNALMDKDKSEGKNQKSKLKAATKDIVAMNKGVQPRYHLLKAKETEKIKLPYKVIDFSRVYSVPYESILQFKEDISSTVVLQTPYVEYVGQRFGNFYSRIGLPKGIREDEITQFVSDNVKIEEA